MKTFLYQAQTAKLGIGKLQYMQKYKHLKNTYDKNCKKKQLTKTGKVKTYITAYRKIYTKPSKTISSGISGEFRFYLLTLNLL